MTIELSPHILVRKAALPYDILSQAQLPKTRQALAQWNSAEAQIQQLGQQLQDFLYDWIPAQADEKVRHGWMSVRRALKKQKNPSRLLLELPTPTPWPAEQLQQLQQLLHCWQQLELHKNSAASVLQQELDLQVRPALQQSLQQADFAHALALNNPRLYHKAQQSNQWSFGKKGTSKTERSLFAYVARAAAKTSPLSTFMANLPAQFVPEQTSLLQADQLSTAVSAEINRGVIARICRFCQQDLRFFKDIQLQKNPSLQWQQGAATLLANVHIELLGRPWRQQQPLSTRVPTWLAELVQQLPETVSWRDVEERLATHAGAAATQWLEQLLDLDVLAAVPLWHGQQADPLQALIDALHSQGTAQGQQVAVQLQQLQQLCLACSQALPADIAGFSQRIERQINALYLQVGARFVEPYQSNWSETVWQQGATIRFGRGLLPLAQQIGHSIAKRIQVDPAYAVLHHAFIEQFGAGGCCTDILQFLTRVQPSFLKQLQQATTVTLPQPRLGVTVYGQLVADSVHSLEQQTPQLVLNLLYERLGWQACRYLPVNHPASANTAGLLRDWLNQAAEEGAEVVEIALSSECNPLQSHQYVTSRVLGWPGEPVEPERCLPLADLQLRHDSSSNQLKFYRHDGTPVQLCYLGAVMPLPDWGLSYLLIKLTEPFHLVRPQHLFQTATDDALVRHTARITEGPLVLYRATWRVKRQALAHLQAEMPDIERLRLLAQFCQQHQLPERCFVSGDLGLSSLDAQEQNLDRYRKPMWCDFSNPLCVEHMLKVLDVCEQLTFREALPDGQQLWFSHNNQNYVTELQMEVLVNSQLTEVRHVA